MVFKWFVHHVIEHVSCEVIPQLWPQRTCLWIDCHFYFWCQCPLKASSTNIPHFLRSAPAYLFHTTANQSSVTALVIQPQAWYILMTLLGSYLSGIICNFKSRDEESRYGLMILPQSCIFLLPNISIPTDFPQYYWQNNSTAYQSMLLFH